MIKGAADGYLYIGVGQISIVWSNRNNLFQIRNKSLASMVIYLVVLGWHMMSRGAHVIWPAWTTGRVSRKAVTPTPVLGVGRLLGYIIPQKQPRPTCRLHNPAKASVYTAAVRDSPIYVSTWSEEWADTAGPAQEQGNTRL